MKSELLLFISILAATATIFGAQRIEAQEPVEVQETMNPLEAVRSDVEQHGWHLVLEEGANSAGTLYSVGLWKTYQRPEIFVSATGTDPRGLSGHVSRLIQRVAEGGTVEPGSTVHGAFGKFPGTVRQVQPAWTPETMPLASDFYGSSDFPAIQVFWPDAEGRFPWQQNFDPQLFPRQPLLFEPNLILANLGLERASGAAQRSGEALSSALGELFVDAGDHSLDDWHWLIGPEAELLQVTLFGNVFFRHADGAIHWLDTHFGESQQVASGEDGWVSIVLAYPNLFFPVATLLELRAADQGLEPGKVFNWITSPLLGGEETLDNVQTISTKVHLISAGRLAQQALKGEAASGLVSDELEARFDVVRNEEGQFSIWPEGRDLPAGWQKTGTTGTKEECLDAIEKAMSPD